MLHMKESVLSNLQQVISGSSTLNHGVYLYSSSIFKNPAAHGSLAPKPADSDKIGAGPDYPIGIVPGAYKMLGAYRESTCAHTHI